MWLLPIFKHATGHEQLVLHDLHDLVTRFRTALGWANYGDGLNTHGRGIEGVRECVCVGEELVMSQYKSRCTWYVADNVALA